MAEIVPNRVPCGRREPEPTPPEPKPIYGLCDLPGITYFKLRPSEETKIEGDYTKNCGLTGDEIDKNFFFLRSMDIKTAYTITEEGKQILVLERMGCGREIRVDITDQDAYDHEFRVDDGYIYVKYPDGHEDPIRDGEGNPVRFLIEGYNVRVVTDASIGGDGTYQHPINVDLAYRTGTYTPADFFVDLTCPEARINDYENIGHGHAIVTKENVSRFGMLYTFNQAQKIDEALAREGRGWRIPTREDWAKLLNWAEPDEENRNHDIERSGNLGCVAGARLKSTVYWDGKANSDDFHFTVYPVGLCPEDFNTAEPNQYGYTGLYKTSSFWSSTEKDGEVYVRTFSYGHDDVAQYTESPMRRLSIRLVRDIADDFDIDEYAEILGNYVPVGLFTDGKQQWTTFNIDFTNYEGFNADEVTVPDAWRDVDQDIEVVTYYQLVEVDGVWMYSGSTKGDGLTVYDLPSYVDENMPAIREDEIPQNPTSESYEYIAVKYPLHLDMVSEAKFYYNGWDGNRWHKKIMREGESIVLLFEDAENICDTAATPYVTSANRNHEWRVFTDEATGLDELVDVVGDAIDKEVSRRFKEIYEAISGLTDDLMELSGVVIDTRDEMASGFTSAFTAIDDAQEEIDRIEAGVGLDEDGNYIQPVDNYYTSSSTSVADAIAILDQALYEGTAGLEEAVEELNEKVDELSGVTEEVIDALVDLQAEVDRAEDAIGLNEDGTHKPSEGVYTSSAETIEGEILALDAALAEVAEDVEELKALNVAPLDASIIVEKDGTNTLVGVNIDPDDKHIKLGGNGIWFDGDFGLI